MTAPTDTPELTRRVILWRRELDGLRSQTSLILRQAQTLLATLSHTQAEEELRPLVEAFPAETDPLLKGEDPCDGIDGRGLHAKDQERDGGRFSKKG